MCGEDEITLNTHSKKSANLKNKIYLSFSNGLRKQTEHFPYVNTNAFINPNRLYISNISLFNKY